MEPTSTVFWLWIFGAIAAILWEARMWLADDVTDVPPLGIVFLIMAFINQCIRLILTWPCTVIDEIILFITISMKEEE